MTQYWVELDVPRNEEWWKRVTAPDFGRDDLPCRELYDEMEPFGIDPFFDDDDPSEQKVNNEFSLRVKAAKMACARCPVQESCLEYALVANIPYGVWGGTTPYERREIGRKFRKNRAQKGE